MFTCLSCLHVRLLLLLLLGDTKVMAVVACGQLIAFQKHTTSVLSRVTVQQLVSAHQAAVVVETRPLLFTRGRLRL